MNFFMVSPILLRFSAVGRMRKGWCLVQSDVLPAALCMLCNINDEYIANGKHPSKSYVTFEDVTQRTADWRNIPFFSAFTLHMRLNFKTRAPAVLARRRPFCLASSTDVVVDPHSPTACDDIRRFLKCTYLTHMQTI